GVRSFIAANPASLQTITIVVHNDEPSAALLREALGSSASTPGLMSFAPDAAQLLANDISHERRFAILAGGDPLSLSVVKTELEKRNIAIMEVSSAMALRSLLRRRVPDVFVIASPWQNNDCYEIIQSLRALEGGMNADVIFIGQESNFSDKLKSIHHGADTFIENSGLLSDLSKKISMLLDHSLENHKILAIDPDQEQAEMTREILEAAGYNLLHLSDLNRFEEQLQSFEPDLLLLESGPLSDDITGHEIAKYLRQNGFAKIPIVFLTKQNKLRFHINSALWGNAHLVKPVASQLLLATIGSRIGKARAALKHLRTAKEPFCY
ncbi:MAG: response regulator, partial [Candidatus Obscuribacterales bacterium]|nr:response regulator [Candidatus Obscuribacterales bacterium]